MRMLKLCSLLAAAAFAGGLSCGFGDIAFPALADEEFSATLLGTNEVPPVTTTATGSAAFAVVDDTFLTYHLTVADMDSTILAHIHAGDATTSGPVIVNLFIANTVACKQNNDTALTIVSSSIANPTTIRLAGEHDRAAASTFLVRIAGHTGAVPDLNGERTATVTGDSTFTVPVNVTVAGAGGTAQRFSLINTTLPPCRVDFTGPLAQAQIRPGSLTAAGIQSYGTTPRERFDSLISLMRTGDVYVNVHTRAHGGGEIRGQLTPQ